MAESESQSRSDVVGTAGNGIQVGHAVAGCIGTGDLSSDYAVPGVFNLEVVPLAAETVYPAAVKAGRAQKAR